MRRLAIILFCLACVHPAAAQEKRPMQLDDLFRFKRVSDPQVSPDGQWVVYVVGTVDMAGNRTTSSLWLVPTEKGEPKQLTQSPKSDRHPRWSPDGKFILFESTRSGEGQLWMIAVAGGEPRQLTTISTGAGNGMWSPDGKAIAFVSAVWPEFSAKPFKESDALNKKRAEEQAKNPVKAKVFTRLFFRHWDEYVEDKRQHLFVAAFDGDKIGEPRDLTPGDRDAYPTSTTFSVGDEFVFSPDGSHLLFTAPPKNNEAWSTNYDIWRAAVDGGDKPVNLTKDNPAADGAPRFSPDGKWLAYRAQKKPGFEADRWELYVTAADPSGNVQGKPRSVTSHFDSWIEEFVWFPKSNGVVFVAEKQGHALLWTIRLESGDVKQFTRTGVVSSLSMSRDGMLAFSEASLHAPPEVFASHSGKAPVGLSRANRARLEELDTPSKESVVVKGAGGTPMQMFLLKPPGFDPAKKWPVAYLVHGGPQGAWTDGWSSRWNPSLWAAQGYVVALPNPHGSTGFGQKYVDEISADWGGKCYEDLMRGVDWLEQQPWVDRDRIAAAGASFGGYMMNWFAVNTGRFKCLITHCSVWNFESMYATTDELWFDEWEHGGPPWGKNRHSYENHSPHRLAANLAKFKTPMLVVHNDLDFRCPIGQGHELFTTLQRLGVPSRMINFPDEGHWVLKPANSRYWHEEVFAWLNKYAPPGGR